MPDRPPIVVPPRWVRRGEFLVCVECGLAQAYCRGHANAADQAAQDGEETRLKQRIAELTAERARLGGR